MVPLRPRQAEEPLLQVVVLTIPEGEAEAHPLAIVANAGQPVLAPAIGPRAGVVVGEVAPRLVPVVAVVLPDRPPRPLRDIRPPPPPRRVAPCLYQPPPFVIRHKRD